MTSVSGGLMFCVFLFFLFIIIVIIVKPDICRYCTEHVNETYLINVVFVCFVCFSRMYESV